MSRKALESGLCSSPSSATLQPTDEAREWVTGPWNKFGHYWLRKPRSAEHLTLSLEEPEPDCAWICSTSWSIAPDHRNAG